ERAPLVGQFGDYQLYTMAPPSSGGVTLLEILGVLNGVDLATMGHNSSEYIHFLAESMQFGFADRAAYLGDPDFVEIPLSELLAPSLAERRRAQILPDACLSPEAFPLDPAMAPHALPEDHGTSHISVVDGQRNLVALTTTVNTDFGSLVVAG